MIILQILPFILEITNKIFGEKTAKFLLNFFSNKEKFFFTEDIYDFQEKKSMTRLVLLLPGKGCEWARKTGGCTMCALSKRSQEIGKNFSSKNLIALYKIAVNFTRKEKPTSLAIYNGGSFLNNNEIPLSAQLEIFRLVKESQSIRKIFIESRAEFIDSHKIKLLKKELGNKGLIVGIGLEAQNDKIRNEFIKKGLGRKKYEETIKLLKENGIITLSYVFLKPIYLTEKESIEEAIKTIKYAFLSGTDEIAIEVAFIQEGTLMEKLFKEKKYKLPWLWSAIEVIKKTYQLGPLHIGGFNDSPPPIAVSSNCKICSLRIKEALQQYSQNNDIGLLQKLDCNCRRMWKEEVGVNL